VVALYLLLADMLLLLHHGFMIH